MTDVGAECICKQNRRMKTFLSRLQALANPANYNSVVADSKYNRGFRGITTRGKFANVHSKKLYFCAVIKKRKKRKRIKPIFRSLREKIQNTTIRDIHTGDKPHVLQIYEILYTDICLRLTV